MFSLDRTGFSEILANINLVRSAVQVYKDAAARVVKFIGCPIVPSSLNS